MAVTEAQSAEVDPKVREIIADLMRRVGELEKQNGEVEQRHAASETKHAESEKRHAASEKETAVIDARLDALATKAELADFRTETLTAIAKLEAQNERNSKNSIKWNVGIGVALIGVIATATGIILAALPS